MSKKIALLGLTFSLLTVESICSATDSAPNKVVHKSRHDIAVDKCEKEATACAMKKCEETKGVCEKIGPDWKIPMHIFEDCFYDCSHPSKKGKKTHTKKESLPKSVI